MYVSCFWRMALAHIKAVTITHLIHIALRLINLVVSIVLPVSAIPMRYVLRTPNTPLIHPHSLQKYGLSSCAYVPLSFPPLPSSSPFLLDLSITYLI